MRKLLMCFYALIITFMFVSCQTSPKATPEISETVKPLAPSSLNLNGKWAETFDWKNDYVADVWSFKSEIIQKGTEITIINLTWGVKSFGTLKGNVIHMEPQVLSDPSRGKLRYPARKCYISPDGNTLTMKYWYIWEDTGGSSGRGQAKTTYKRE